MKVSRYLTIFTFATHWFLSRAEAHEVVDDCYKLFDTSFRSDDNIIARCKSPFRAARYFVRVEFYRRWLVVFSAMMLCLIVPTVLFISGKNHPAVAAVSLITGGMISLVWFRCEKSEYKTAPRYLLISLSAIIVVWGGVTAIIVLALLYPEIVFSFLPALPAVWIGKLFTYALVGVVALSFISGLMGLVCARVIDRRWRSMYIFCLMSIAVCTLVLSAMRSLNPIYFVEVLLVPFVLLTMLVGFFLAMIALR